MWDFFYKQSNQEMIYTFNLVPPQDFFINLAENTDLFNIFIYIVCNLSVQWFINCYFTSTRQYFNSISTINWERKG